MKDMVTATQGTTASTATWNNWSGSVVCAPKTSAAPKDTDALQQLLRSSSGTLRVKGAGHSFMPIAATQGTLISLEQMQGDVLSVSGPSDAPTVRMQAGASLNRLSRAMQDKGVAFKNLGDIDVQSLAGATQTATHGTGQSFPCLAGEIQAVRLLLANGDIVQADRDTNRDLLLASRVSLGTLGILLDADVSVQPAYKLHRRVTLEPLQEVLSDARQLWASHRNFEIFALPFCDYAVKLVHDETEDEDRHDNPGDDDLLLKALRGLRTLTKHMPSLRRTIINRVARSVKPEVQIGNSWELLASARNIRFNEMEYHLPVEHGLDVLAEVLHLIESEQREVYFPLECRMTAADDSWLSPFNGGPRISVAVHACQKDDYQWMFEKVEPIFRRAGGRPHWGKLHSLTAHDALNMYPNFEAFQTLRAELDPSGRFLNDHLAQLFGAS